MSQIISLADPEGDNMNRKSTVRRIAPFVFLILLCMPSILMSSSGQNGGGSGIGLESVDVIVHIFNGGDKDFVGYNIEISSSNSTSMPLNTSKLAFNDHFKNARFSVVGGGAFLRVSYDVALDVIKAETYADDILGEFESVFNLPINVARKTNVVNNETASIDIYYQLGGIQWNVASFEELTKYRPMDGFGQLVTTNLLISYLQDDLIPGTIVNRAGLHHVEYNLTRTNEELVWQFGLEVVFQTLYQNEGQVYVDVNELLNHSGPIEPFGLGSSQIRMFIWKKEFDSSSVPLTLSFDTSSPPYTTIEEESDTYDLIYNLTSPVDNILVTLQVAREGSLNWICLAAGVVAAFVAVAVMVVFVFVRRRRKKPHQQ